MRSSRLAYLSVFTILLPFGATDPNSVCISYGIDFVDDQSYFINSASNDPFTCVSTFSGCNNDVADVLLVDPTGEEYLCSQIPTTVPDNTPELSTCPILKSQMIPGAWMILVSGDNDDGNPFAWERDISLDVGVQATITSTPTATFFVTTIPTVTSTSTQVITQTLDPTTTITVKATRYVKTVTPRATTVTTTRTFTRAKIVATEKLKQTTKTVTASCTIPARSRDRRATYHPTLITPAALATSTKASEIRSSFRTGRKQGRAVDYESARRRIETARRQQKSKEIAARGEHKKRAPDTPTYIITADTIVNTIVTVDDPTSTSTISALATTTSTLQLPPVTVTSGVARGTTTLRTPTKTRLVYAYTTTTRAVTITATFTKTKTITPQAAAASCTKAGGHFGLQKS